MSRMSTREDNIKFIVELTKKSLKAKQYKRLISNKLFPEEDFDELYESVMEYLINIEEYEKCGKLLKLKQNG